jgi:hypothetical protein
MPGWADVADITESVEVRGNQVALTPLHGKHFAALLKRFPDAMKALQNREFGKLLDHEDCIDALIAMGTGADNDEAAQGKIANLTVGEKGNILTRILEVNLPGAGSPLEKLVSAYVGLSRLSPAEVSDTRSEQPQPSS